MYIHIMEYSRRPQVELILNENIPGMQMMSLNCWYLFSKTRLDTIHSTVLPVLTDTHTSELKCLWCECHVLKTYQVLLQMCSYSAVVICSHKSRFQDLSCDSMSIKDRPQALFSDLLKYNFLIPIYLEPWRRRRKLMTTQAFNIVNN